MKSIELNDHATALLSELGSRERFKHLQMGDGSHDLAVQFLSQLEEISRENERELAKGNWTTFAELDKTNNT